MGTVIAISLIFLVLDMMIVGIFYAVYGKKWKYENGMLLCIHIPASAAESEEIRKFSFVTVQPAERLRHPAIENRFAMGRMPAGPAFSYGLCSKCTDLAEL